MNLPTPAATQAPIFRPGARFLLAHPAHFIALGLGSGLARIAPGTVGTLWAWLAFLVMHLFLSPLALAGVILASTAVGWWACTVTSEHLGVSDSSHIVWDEVVAFWLVLLLVLPAGLGMQAAAFALFRFFDAVKFGPVAWADRHFKGLGPRGGFGILLDDLVAAFCTLLVLAAWVFFFGL